MDVIRKICTSWALPALGVFVGLFATAAKGQTWTATDVGTVAATGSYSYNSSTGVHTIGGAGADITSTSDGFRYVYSSLSNDCEMIARVASQSNTNVWAKSGLMIRQSTASGSVNALIAVTPGNGVTFQSRSSSGGSTTTSLTTASITAPRWLKICKDGNNVSVFQGSDGTTWVPMGAVQLPFTGAADIGMAVCSHSTSTTLCTATFDNVSVTTAVSFPPPSPWLDQDIGSPSKTGQVHYEDSTWMITEGGGDITGTSDTFHFVYQPLSGNGSIIAKVASEYAADPWTKVGVMIRNSLAANSANGGVFVTPGNGVSFQYRATAGASGSASSGASVTAPYWVKLSRAGSVLTAYQSSDGTTFTQVGSPQTITLSTNVYMGLAVTSHNSAMTAATLSNVQVFPSTLSIINHTDTFFDLVWPALANPSSIAQYEIDRDSSIIGYSTTTDFQDIQLAPATTFVYQTKALNSSGTVIASSPTLTVSTDSPWLPSPWTHIDLGNVGLGGQSQYDVTTSKYTITGAGGGITGTADACQFAYQTLSGDGQVMLRVTSFPSGSSSPLTGIMMRDSTSPGSKMAALLMTPNNGNTFLQTRSSSAGSTSQTGYGSAGYVLWMKLVRQGSVITAFKSTDGIGWSMMGSATVSFGTTTYVGLATTSGNATFTSTSVIDNVSVVTGGPSTNPPTTPGTPTSVAVGDVSASIQWTGSTDDYAVTGYTVYRNGVSIAQVGTNLSFTDTGLTPGQAYAYTIKATNWAGITSSASSALNITTTAKQVPNAWKHGEIGSVGLAGTGTYTSGTFTLKASGSDVWSSADSFGFVYRKLSGDGQLTARVASVTHTDDWTKAGVMMRQSLDPGSANVFMMATPSNGTNFQSRDLSGYLTSQTGANVNAPIWVRLVRSGNVFTGYTSTDGTTWTYVMQQTIALNSALYVGLAETAHANGQLATATFDNVDLTATDSDSDGLPDWWENYYFGNLSYSGTSSVSGNGITLADAYANGLDPNNYYNQLDGSGRAVVITPTLAIVSGNNQTSAPSSFATNPLVVSVTNGGTAMNNAPVLFTVTTGGGLLAATTTGTTAATFSARTNSSGQAQCSFQQPTSNNVTSQIGATTSTQSATFTETSFTGPPPTITGATLVTAPINTAFSYAITASDSPTSYGASGLPAGLSINTTTGVISGTPTAAGISSITLAATNTAGTGTGNLVLHLVQSTTAPVINSPTAATALAGTALSYQIAATHNPTQFAATSLPSGLSVNPYTGLISGTVATAGTYTINLSATNSAGTGNAALTLVVNSAPTGSKALLPFITSSLTASATVGTSFTYTITATHSPTSYAGASLPDGLSINTSTGVISGTPTTDGKFSILISAGNTSGISTSILTLTTASAAPVITSATSASCSTADTFGYSITASNLPTGFSATSLPTGLILDTTTGAIDGTVATPGTYTFRISATNSAGTGTSSVSLTVSPEGIPVITSAGSTTAVLGESFSYSTTATNFPTSYSATGLPAGLIINSTTGVISGTPTTVGTPAATITLTNSTGSASYPLAFVVLNSTAAATGTITVNASSVYGIGIDDNDPSEATGPTSHWSIGSGANEAESTEADRLLVKFDLSGIHSYLPPDAVLTSAALNLIENGDSIVGTGMTIELHASSAPFETPPVNWTDNSGYQSTLLSSLDVATAGDIYTLPSSTNFVSSVQGAYAGESGLLYLTLLSPGAETSGNIQFLDLSQYPQPTLTLTYTTDSPPVIGNITSGQTIPITQGGAYTLPVQAGNAVTSYSESGLPAGLTLDTATGVISGTATTTGTSTVTITATNGNGTGSTTFTMTVGNVPSITSTLTLSATANSPITPYTITATNSPTSYSASNLPSGLFCNPTTGVISGTPDIIYSGTLTSYIFAHNDFGFGSANLSIVIAEVAPIFTGTLSPVSVTQGQAITNLNVPYRGVLNSLTVTGFPSGFGMSSNSSGQVLGTPTTTGTYTGTVTAVNSAGSSQPMPLTLVVIPIAAPVVSDQWGSGILNEPMSVSVPTTIEIPGNSTAPSSPVYTATNLPAGLTVHGGSGFFVGEYPAIVSGTVTAAGTQTAQIYASNTTGTGTGQLTLTIYPTKPGIAGSSMTNYARVGQGVLLSFHPIDSSSTMTSSASGLPTGLAYTGTTGNISITGTATTTGTYLSTVSITDGSVSPSLTSTGTITFVIAPAIANYTATAQVGVPFSYQVVDAVTAKSFSASNLPSGLTINASTGLISGTPVAADTVTGSFTIADAAGVQPGTLLLKIAANSGDYHAEFQQGVGPVASYTVPSATIETDSSDATVAEETFDTANFLTVGRASTTVSSRAVLAFDLSSLPAGATITSATLVATASSGNSSGAPLSVEAHKLSGPFSADTSNWTNNSGYSSGVLTSLTLDPAATATSYTFPTYAAFTQAVQHVSNATDRHLYMTLVAPAAEVGSTANYFGFVTNATTPSQNPRLVVTYTLGTGGAPIVTSPSVMTGTVNVPVAFNLTATNNPGSFAVTSLPTGLTLSSDVISGTVSTASSTIATLTATNSAGTGTKTITINIDSATPADTLEVSTDTNNQVGVPGIFLTAPVTVRAFSGGTPLAHTLVTFTVSPGKGGFSTINTGTPLTYSSLTVVTDDDGYAKAYFLLPQSLGTVTIVASAGTAQPVSLVETAALDSSGTSSSLILLSVLSGEGQSGPSGQTLAQPFVVQAADVSGKALVSQSLSLNVVAGGGQISTSSGGTYTGSFTTSTDTTGKATIYLQPGTGDANGNNRITCDAPSGSATTTVSLTALTTSGSSTAPTPGGGTPPNVDDPLPSIKPPVVTITPFTYVSPTGDIIPEPLPDSTHITISWLAVDHADTYLVERMDDKGTWKTLATTSDLSITDQHLYANINYQYRVTAYNGSDKSDPSTTTYLVPLIAGLAVLSPDRVDSSYDGKWVDFPASSVTGGNGDTWISVVTDGANQGFRIIFNPTRTSGTFTWYYYGDDGSGTTPLFPVSSPTNVRETPIYHGFFPYVGLQIDGVTGSNSVMTSGQAPGGTISSTSDGEFTIWDEDFGITYSATITFNASSSFDVKDGYGNSISSGYVVDNSANWEHNFEAFGVKVTPTPLARAGDHITFTVTAIPDGVGEGTPIGTQTFTYTYQPNPPDYSIPVDESSGSRYRKLALNGLPMGDEKPQQSAESDQEKEETYIDAMTLGLRHSTTDAYLPVSGSDFSVSARRDFRSQIWNDHSGLTPHEMPDTPFGMCWSSNLAPNIKFTHNKDPKSTTPDEAFVCDETGAVHTFYRWYDESGGPQYFPMPSARNEAQVPNLETLTRDGTATPATYIFKRKYGATLLYQETGFSQSVPNDRVHGSTYSTVSDYARLVQATDRVGNIVNYTFSGTTNLVPATITVANQPGTKLYIQQTPITALSLGITNPQSVITAIWDANGNKTTYQYSVAPKDANAVILTSVTTSDEGVTHYTYDGTNEDDLTPRPVDTDPTVFAYVDLASITDPLGHTYAFTYAMDHSKLNYMNNPSLYTGYFIQSGCPRNVASVTMPDATSSTFANNSVVWVEAATGGVTIGAKSTRSIQATDSAGVARTFTWGDPVVIALPSFPQPTNSQTKSKMIAYQSMTIDYGAHGSESFQFDVNASMALNSMTDLSHNTTTYAHTDAWTAPATYSKIIANATLNGFYGDPTSQTNALGQTKTFTYYGGSRVMQSSTDERGTKTYNDIDSLGRRTSEKIYEGGTSLVQETDFAYANDKYPGFMTSKTVKKLSGDTSSAVDMTTQNVPDANGRLAQEIVDPGGLNLVTKYTYDANGNKLTAVDPRGNTTWFSYDSRNRLVTVTFADGAQKQMQYDTRGNKTLEYDENGLATIYKYDSLNRLWKQARDMNGNGVLDEGTDLVSVFTYNAVNSKLTFTDPNGNTTTMTYDDLQRVSTITDARSGLTQFSYGANSGGNAFDSSSFKPTHTVDPRGFTADVSYDALYRPVTKSAQYDTMQAPASTTTHYDEVGNPDIVTDPLGHQTTTSYDALNRPTLVTYADGTTSSTAYTSTGLKWKATDPNLHETRTQFDAAGRATQVTAGYGTADASTSRSIYDAAGNVAELVNPLGAKTDFAYDARNRKVQEFEAAVYDAANNATTRPALEWFYDQGGRTTGVVDARGSATDTTYDAANRTTDVYQPAVTFGGTSTRPHVHSTYDKNGNVLTATDPNSHTTTNTYDELNRLLTTTDAASIVVTNTYDAVGNKLTVKDGLNQVTTFGYDGLNRNTSVTDAAGKVTKLIYNEMNKVQRIDALGQLTTYLYDDRNRLSNVVYSSSAAANSQRNYAYDDNGNLLSVTEPSKTAANVGYTYDALNRVITETSQGKTHTYTYDAAGNRLATLYGGTNRKITSTYDALNRLLTMQDQTATEVTASSAGRTTTYAYDLNGNIKQKTAPNGDTEVYSYDVLNRATIESAQTGGAVALFTYNYGYDLAGNVLTVAESYPSGLSNRTVTNTYDNINRLLTEAVTGSAPNATTTYTYDAGNNRSTKVITGTGATSVSYSYNTLNQLTSYTDGTRAVALTYDLNGNRKTRVVTGGTDNGTDTHSYDFENRLIGLVKGTSGGSGTYAYSYDYRTRRIVRDETNASGTITNLVYSGGTSVQEYDGTTPALIVEYLRGSDYGGGVGGILYTVRSGTPSYTHENRRGDVVAKTAADGSLTYQAQYEAFGKETATSGSTPDRQKSNSKDNDPTGLVNEGFRYRDLETGMFTTRDPAGFVDGPNLYTYVRQNPYTKFDPEGLADEEVVGSTEDDLDETGAGLRYKDPERDEEGKPIFGSEEYERETPPKTEGQSGPTVGNGPGQIPPMNLGPSLLPSQGPPKTEDEIAWEAAKQMEAEKANNGSATTTKNPPSPNGRNGNQDHQADVANNNAQNPPLQPQAVGNRVPDGVGQPGQSVNIRGQQISPEGPSARVITESERYNKNGQINSAGRGQIRDVRAADPTATIVVTDPADPQREPSVYPPGTQPPPQGRLPSNAPTAVPAPTAQPPPKPTTPPPSTSS